MLVTIYTINRRDYFVDAETEEEAVEKAYKRINDYDDETLEEQVRVEGKLFSVTA